MHYASDPTMGYRHAINDDIWAAYVADFYPVIITMCNQEFAPPKTMEDDQRELCPICFPVENKKPKLSKNLSGQPLARSFIQLPLTVEAQQLLEQEPFRIERIVEWGEKNGVSMTYLGKRVGMRIANRVGTVTAKETDWIVKTQENNFYVYTAEYFWPSHEER